MPRYRVSFTQQAWNYLSIWIDAVNEDAAAEAAQAEWDRNGEMNFHLDDTSVAHSIELDDVVEDEKKE